MALANTSCEKVSPQGVLMAGTAVEDRVQMSNLYYKEHLFEMKFNYDLMDKHDEYTFLVGGDSHVTTDPGRTWATSPTPRRLTTSLWTRSLPKPRTAMSSRTTSKKKMAAGFVKTNPATQSVLIITRYASRSSLLLATMTSPTTDGHCGVTFLVPRSTLSTS